MEANADGAFVIEFVVAAFSIDAVKRAAYMLMERINIAVDIQGDVLRCTLKPAKAGVDMSIAERDFRREVLDQDLRLTIEQQTEPYRNAILGLAFSRTGLQDG